MVSEERNPEGVSAGVGEGRGARITLRSREGRAQAWLGASDIRREQPGKAKVG